MNDTLHLTCPHCHAVNRVPSDRLAAHPNCGKCHQRIFDGRPLELTSTTFDRHIAYNDIPVLVDFWAPWCGPCKIMAPEFERASVQLEPKIRLAKLDTDAEQAIASRYAIRSIPTLALFIGGLEVGRQTGAMGAPEIVRWVQSVAR